jgi:hypothetical protein
MTRKNTVLHLKNPFVYAFCGRRNTECHAFQTAHPGKPAASIWTIPTNFLPPSLLCEHPS